MHETAFFVSVLAQMIKEIYSLSCPKLLPRDLIQLSLCLYWPWGSRMWVIPLFIRHDHLKLDILSLSRNCDYIL